MLLGLSIHNVVLIDALKLALSSGFTALTGETGAGKSILLDALSLALGAKADPGLIRVGTDMAVVVATFSLEDFPKLHPVFSLIEEHALVVDEDTAEPKQLLLKRTLHRTQKSKAFINDQPVSLALLKQFGDLLLHVHGQHDHLLNEDLHKTILDDFAHICFKPDTSGSFGSFAKALSAVKDAFADWAEAKSALVRFEDECERHKQQRAFYDQIRKDLNGVTLTVGLEDALIERRQALQQLGKIISTVEQTLKGLETPTSWVSTLYGFQKGLERCDSAAFKPLQNAILALERAGIELTEAQAELRSLYDEDRSAAQELEKIDEQLHQLRSLARKYHTTCDGLHALYEEATQAILSADDILVRRAELSRAVVSAFAAYGLAEAVVYDLRMAAARQLEQKVMIELPDLKLERARFEVMIQQSKDAAGTLKPAIDGGHAIAFWVAMNVGQSTAPLVKSASGGEMARLMLVLKMIIAKSTAMPTLIFDEIDTGVGGAVAMAIGKKLHALGGLVQVLSITHSPQVAAAAHCQLRIYKTESDTLTTTHVVGLTDAERVAEVARMLAGANVTDEARRAAEVLLAEQHTS